MSYVHVLKFCFEQHRLRVLCFIHWIVQNESTTSGYSIGVWVYVKDQINTQSAVFCLTENSTTSQPGRKLQQTDDFDWVLQESACVVYDDSNGVFAYVERRGSLTVYYGQSLIKKNEWHFVLLSVDYTRSGYLYVDGAVDTQFDALVMPDDIENCELNIACVIALATPPSPPPPSPSPPPPPWR